MRTAARTDHAEAVFHTEYLNTPRLVADDTQKTVWKWEQQEPFGVNAANDDPDADTIAFEFNLRFPGQYFDKETNAHYNYFRDYDPTVGRYVQSDPIGLRGGLNTYHYVYSAPQQGIDRLGLFGGGVHFRVTYEEFVRAGYPPSVAESIATHSVLADWRPSFPISQAAENAHRHGMGRPGEDPREAFQGVQRYIEDQIRRCTPEGLGNATHAGQDTAAGGHNYNQYSGSAGLMHVFRDFFPLQDELDRARRRTREVLRQYERVCGCLPGKQPPTGGSPPGVPPVLYYAP